MAAHFQELSHKPIEDMMKDLKVDPSVELKSSSTVSSKKGSSSDATSCISTAGDTIDSVKEGDVDHESMNANQGFPYPTGSYYGYYSTGYDGSFGELDDQGYYVAGDRVEFQYPVMQTENGSLIYFVPGFQLGYSPYGPYFPVNTVNVSGQSVGQQPHSLSPMFTSHSSGYFPSLLSYGELTQSQYLWDPSPFAGDVVYGNGHGGVADIPGFKSNISSPSHTLAPLSKEFLPSDLRHPLETKNSLPPFDVSTGHGIRNQIKSSSKASQHDSTFQSDTLDKGYYPFTEIALHNQGKGGVVYSNNPVSMKANGRGWGVTEKPKPRSKVNSVGDITLLNEQNHGPRAVDGKDALISGGNDAGFFVAGNGNSNSIASLIRRDQYNLADFPTKYDHAFFFVIKSYSEDDIHKSIKYNVWASTPNGNRRLDTAYQDAQNRMAEKGSNCPVFLFFSVNASGQFCGVAEMIGQVDYEKTMDFWQQDKWSGYFPVKWHIIKDVPNPQLRHIILENNDNKPVTNSRDTQEVRFPQGIEMLNIFKSYASKTSILDDFDFYESREKVMLEKKMRPILHFPQIKLKAEELAIGFQSVDQSAAENIGDQSEK